VTGTLTLRRVGLDPDLPELELAVALDGWSATATVYVDLEVLLDAAARLARFSRTLTGEIAVHLGADGTGLVAMRWTNARATGRVRCRLTLDTGGDSDHRRSVTLPLETEPAALDRFLPAFRTLLETGGPATLELW
jgi:hypothetical protein